jgi:hypothetical protein|tara:strand:- start:647 stop:1090 length:444 start_codon:yes stop_codon:yes gene_type:complete
MKNKVGDINVNYSEFAYFSRLSENDRLNYFFQLFEGEVVKPGLDLKEFFNQLDSDTTNLTDKTDSYTYDSDDISDSSNLVEIMIDNEFIMIESNSLKSIRIVITRFMESGYMLSRDLESEKMFKQDKRSRFLRVYQIIDQTTGICLN